MIILNDEKDCCGCGACIAACPQQCISVREGTLGHIFPQTDVENCIGCEKCEKVCPMRNELPKRELIRQKAYASYAKNEELRFMGSSGGLFGVFARYLMNQGYSVYGAAFDDSLKLKCTVANTPEELKALYKSKYIQSSLLDKFGEIKAKLSKGEKVFFVSTPCQVKALILFLSRKYDNLFTVDFFCHGVPSQRFFDECIAFENKKLGGYVRQYQFRTKKRNGATPHYFTEKIEVGQKQRNRVGFYFDSPFYAFFQKYINLRESCYGCSMAGRQRASDITIGDFHDIDKYVKGINRFDGVSTVIVNTSKGESVWLECSDEVRSLSMDIDRLIDDGICLNHGTERPQRLDEFVADYSTMSMEQLIKKWVNPKTYWKARVYYLLPTQVRKVMKKVVGK